MAKAAYAADSVLWGTPSFMIAQFFVVDPFLPRKPLAPESTGHT